MQIIHGGGGGNGSGPPPPPGKLQSYQASIKCPAIIGPHLMLFGSYLKNVVRVPHNSKAAFHQGLLCLYKQNRSSEKFGGNFKNYILVGN